MNLYVKSTQCNPSDLRSLPYRYAQPQISKTGDRPFFCMNPFLNIYSVPKDCILSKQDARSILSSLVGKELLSLLPQKSSFSDCIRLLTYAIGFFSAGDLAYYLGMDETFLRSFLAATEKSYHNLVRYKSRKNYNSYHYYLYKPASFPFICWSRLIPSPTSYAGKVISMRSIPHGYSTSLSCLMLDLWILRDPTCYFEFHPEVSLGNYTDAATKSAAKVTMDALCILKDQERDLPRALICLEQDMGTENYTTLLSKLYDYSQTFYFDDGSADGIYLVFSCNRLTAATPRKNIYEKKWHVALYALIRQLLSLQRKDNVLDGDMLSVLPASKRYWENLYRRGADAALKAIYSFGILPEMEENSLFGISLSEIDQCLLSLSEKIPDIFSQFLAALGIYPSTARDPFNHTPRLPLRVFREFLLVYPDDADYLTRIQYNRFLYDTAMARHRGLALSILSVMLLMRSIRPRSGSAYTDDSIVSLYPIYQGYSIYTVATPLLSNYMPYMLWDRSSEEIAYLESCLAPYLSADIHSYTYSTLSPQMDIGRGGQSFSSIQEGAYFPDGRFRHYYSVNLPNADDTISAQQFCVEDLDGDTGAYCRAYLFLRYYAAPDALHLIMLVDSPDSALNFYTTVVWGKKLGEFSQSPRCRVPLYADGMMHSLSWDTPRLLFLERGNNILADKRLFAILQDRSILYYR